jgi:hypothetical protein
VALQYRVTGWGGLRRQTPKAAEDEKKYLKFDASGEKKSTDEGGADIVITDTNPSKKDVYQPSKLNKTRYQPGKDRAQKRRKK